MAGKSSEEKEAKQVEAAKVKASDSNEYQGAHARNRRKNEREDKDVTFMGVNVNSLAYWSKESNKAARLKCVFQE